MRLAIARLSVVACVGLAAAAGVVKLDDTMGVFDLRADQNSTRAYIERTYPAEEWVAGDWAVMEAGRLWMPRDASYRVVIGPRFVDLEYSRFAQYFLLGRLLPREQTTSEGARWVFCYGCTHRSLGRKFERIAGSPPGLMFGRMRS